MKTKTTIIPLTTQPKTYRAESISALLVLFLLFFSFQTSAQTTWYSKSATANTNANTAANWSSTTDGTGGSPGSLTTAGYTFIIQSGHQYQLTAAATLGSATSIIQIQSGGALDLNNFSLTNLLRFDIAGTGVLSSGALFNSTGTLTMAKPIALTAAATIKSSGTGLLTLSGAMTYAGNTLTVTGAQATTISGASTLTADTTIMSSGSGLLTVSSTITNSTFTLTIDGSSATTLSSVIGTGTGGLTKTGTGTLTVSGANTYTGTTTINNGTLKISAAAKIPDASALVVTFPGIFDLNTFAETVGSIAGTGTITSGAAGAVTLTAGGDNTNTGFSGVIQNGSGTVAITKTGTGTLTLSGTNTFTGITTISAGTLSVGTIGNGSVSGNLGAATNAAANLVLSGGTLQYTGATASTDRNYTLTAATTSSIEITTAASALTISGTSTATTGALTKIGTGTLILSGTNGHTGLTTVTAGKLQYGASNALSTGAVTVNDGGTYDLNGFSDTIGVLTVNSGSTGGTVSTGAGSLTTGNITSTGGSSNALISGKLVLGSTTTITTTNAADGLTISAVVSTSNGISKAGLGTLTMSGTNTYTGITTISAGTLSVGTINNGGTAGNLGQASNAAANLVLSGGTLQYTGATASTDRNYTLTAATTSSIEITNAASALTISGASTGTTGALTKIGTGTLILSGTNNYTGLTTVSAGKLQYGITNALLSGAVTVNDGGTYDLNGFSDTIGVLTVNSGSTGGTVSTGSGSLTTGNITSTGGSSNALISGKLVLGATTTITTTNAADGLTISAVVSAAFGISKAGLGTLTMSGTNTYTGITTISAGTLSVGTINDGGVAGNLGQAPVAAANLVLSGGTLQYTGATASTNRNYTLTAATTSSIEITTTATTLTISGASTATTGALTKIGTGILKISGLNLYTGITTITAGTLELGVANAISGPSDLVLNGGTFSTGSGTGFGEASGKIGTLTLNNNSTINLGTGVHSIVFVASNTASWATGTTLTITGWTGTAGVSGTAGKLFSGAAATGLTSAQLAKITFTGYPGTASILSTGEFVPFAICTTPTAQPTSLVLSSVTKTTLSGSFTAASPAPSKYLVVRGTSSTAPTPVNGTAYTAGTTLGTGKVIQASAATSFTDSGLYSATTYYYYIFSYNDSCSGQPYYRTTSPLTNSTTTLTATTWYVDDGSNTNDVYTTFMANGVTAGIGGSDSTGNGTLDKPYATVTKAYSVASAGDIIYVDSGTYTGTGLDPNNTFSKSDIQIIGAGATLTIFKSPGGSNTTRFGIITASNLTFKNLEISSYAATSDGIALTITAGTGILFDHVIIYNNVGSGGQGAIYIEGVSTEVTFKNSSFPCNRSASALYGGGFKICGSTVSFSNCSLNNNVISGLRGGAMYITGYYNGASYVGGANVTIDSCTFDANESNDGGAIAIYGDGSTNPSAFAGGTVSITHSCFSTNNSTDSSPDGGGAIYVNASKDLNLTISDCSFTSNTSTGNGGAVYIKQSGGALTCTMSSNSFGTNSAGSGEDIYFNSGSTDITLKNNTFSSVYSGTNVNMYNNGMSASSIKFEGLTTASGTGGNGDIVADGSGVAVTKPEMSGAYTESSTNIPTSLPSTTCNDRFDGTCGTTSATFACETTNTFDDITASALLTGRGVTGTTTTKNITTGGISRSSNTLTINATAHGFSTGNWVVVSGNSVSDYNRAYKIQSVSTNSFTVSVANITSLVTSVSTSTVSGTVTKGTIALGWDRETIPTTFECAIINYDYNTNTYGNIDACSMIVNSGKTLTVDNGTNGTYVYVVNSITNNGTINVSSKGNLVQVNYPLDINNNTIVTPSITVNKTTGNKIKWDYIYWGKPVTAAASIMSAFTSFDVKYYWDPDYCTQGIERDYLGWRTLSGEPVIGTGFITRVKTALGNTPAPISLNMSGVSNNGDITASVKYYPPFNVSDDQSFRNSTLLGNPYPGAIYFSDFYNDNSNYITGTVSLWSSNTPYPGSGEYQGADYATFNLTGGVGSSPSSQVPYGYIASGQGFMVKAKATGTVTFKNAHRTKVIPSNDQFFRINPNAEKDRFWLRITDATTNSNEQLIGYVPGATNDYDDAYDGQIESINKLKFYSFVPKDSKRYIIQGKGPFSDLDRVAVGFDKGNTTPEVLSISVSKKEGVFASEQDVYVYDKELNVYANISFKSYEFTSSANMDNRFEILYKTNADFVNDQNVEVVFKNNIFYAKADEDIASVKLYDLSGKLVYEKANGETWNVYSDEVYLSTGIYIAKVTLTNNKTFTRKLIKP